MASSLPSPKLHDRNRADNSSAQITLSKHVYQQEIGAEDISRQALTYTKRNSNNEEFPLGSRVQVQVASLGGWVPGKVVDPEHEGFLTVEVVTELGSFRKHVLAKSNHIILDEQLQSSCVHSTASSFFGGPFEIEGVSLREDDPEMTLQLPRELPPPPSSTTTTTPFSKCLPLSDVQSFPYVANASDAFFLLSLPSSMNASLLRRLNNQGSKRPKQEPRPEFYNADRFIDEIRSKKGFQVFGVGTKKLLSGIPKAKPLQMESCPNPLVWDQTLHLKQGFSKDGTKWLDAFRYYSTLTKKGVLIIAGDVDFFTYWRGSQACRDEVEHVPDERLFVFFNDTITNIGKASHDNFREGHIVWRDGTLYQGSLINGKMHGPGMITRQDGTQYKGEFIFGECQKPWEIEKTTMSARLSEISTDDSNPAFPHFPGLARSENPDVLILFLAPGLTSQQMQTRCDYECEHDRLTFDWQCVATENEFIRKLQRSKFSMLHIEGENEDDLPKAWYEEYPDDKLFEYIVGRISPLFKKDNACKNCFVNFKHLSASRGREICKRFYKDGQFVELAGWKVAHVGEHIRQQFCKNLYATLNDLPTSGTIANSIYNVVELTQAPVFVSSSLQEDTDMQIDGGPDGIENITNTLQSMHVDRACKPRTKRKKVVRTHRVKMVVDQSPCQKEAWEDFVRVISEETYLQRKLACISHLEWVEVILDTEPQIDKPDFVTPDQIKVLERELTSALGVKSFRFAGFGSLKLRMELASFLGLRRRWRGDIVLSTPVEWGAGEVIIRHLALGNVLWTKLVIPCEDSGNTSICQKLHHLLSTSFGIAAYYNDEDDSTARSSLSSSADLEQTTKRRKMRGQSYSENDLVEIPREISKKLKPIRPAPSELEVGEQAEAAIYDDDDQDNAAAWEWHPCKVISVKRDSAGGNVCSYGIKWLDVEEGEDCEDEASPNGIRRPKAVFSVSVSFLDGHETTTRIPMSSTFRDLQEQLQVERPLQKGCRYLIVRGERVMNDEDVVIEHVLDYDYSFNAVMQHMQHTEGQTPLTSYFEHVYHDGIPMDPESLQSAGYIKTNDPVTDQPVLYNEKTGVCVWQFALDFSKSSKHRVAFHFTSEQGFRTATHVGREYLTIFRSLVCNRGAFCGEGLYATQREPHEFQSMEAILCNFYGHGVLLQQNRWRYCARYCLPVIVDEEHFFDVMKRKTPEMIQIGEDRFGYRLNSIVESGRDIIVLRVLGQGQILADNLEKALRKRLDFAKGAKQRSEEQLARDHLGRVRLAHGKYDEALQQYSKALKIKIASLGENHPEVATTLNNMGAVYNQQTMYEEALQEYSKALRIYIASCGENHPSVATTRNNMGLVYSKQSKHDMALQEYSIALRIYMASCGENHPEVATTRNNMGLVYSKQSKHDMALQEYSIALMIYIASCGENHPSVATTRNNMGLVYSKQSKHDMALQEYSKALKIYIGTCGENHPEVAATRNNMGLVYSKQSKYDMARQEYSKALKIYIASLGENHPEVVTTENYILSLQHGSEMVGS